MTTDIDLQIIKEAHNYKAKFISSLDADEIIRIIQDIDSEMERAALTLKVKKAEKAACLNEIDRRNEARRAANLKEYVIPVREVTLPKEKSKSSPSPKVSAADKPIIDLFKQVKSLNSVIALLSGAIDENTIRLAIKNYTNGDK